MRNDCTRSTTGLEKTRERKLGLWASSRHILDILLSQGHFLLFIVNFFAKEQLTWTPAYWASKL